MCVARNAPMGEELDRAWLGKDRERRRRAGQARIIHRALGGTGSGAGEMAAHNFRNSGVPDFHSPGSAFPQIRIPELVAKEKKEDLLHHLVNLLQAWHAERVNDGCFGGDPNLQNRGDPNFRNSGEPISETEGIPAVSPY